MPNRDIAPGLVGRNGIGQRIDRRLPQRFSHRLLSCSKNFEPQQRALTARLAAGFFKNNRSENPGKFFSGKRIPSFDI